MRWRFRHRIVQLQLFRPTRDRRYGQGLSMPKMLGRPSPGYCRRRCLADGGFAPSRRRNCATIRSGTISARYGRMTIHSLSPGSGATGSIPKRAGSLRRLSKQPSISSTTVCLAGFDRKSYDVPVRYPVACHPQAWAAGAVPYLLQAVLGLTPEGFEHRLRIRHPVLPEFVRWLELHRLRVGHAHADLRFERAQNGTVHVTVVNIDGDLDVVVEDGGEDVRKWHV